MTKKSSGPIGPLRDVSDDNRYCLLAGALSAGGVVLFMSVLAGGVVAGRLVAAPVVVLYLFFNRKFIAGMMAGAIKE